MICGLDIPNSCQNLGTELRVIPTVMKSIFWLRVRLRIIRNARIKNVCKYESCMVSKLRIIFKRTVHWQRRTAGRAHQQGVVSSDLLDARGVLRCEVAVCQRRCFRENLPAHEEQVTGSPRMAVRVRVDIIGRARINI